MVAYVIHNPEREDRRLILENELKEQGIFAVLFPAIKDGKKGIAKAHKNIVRHAKEMGLSEVLILEDDVRFCGPGSFQYFLDNKPKEFDLYLAGIYFGQIDPIEKTVKKFSGLHCYIVHSRFYDNFLSVRDEGNIDKNLTGFGKYVVCDPFAAVQHNGFSDNVKKQVQYDHHLDGRQFYNNFQL